jgi:iron-sulfur cluster assembly protein
MDQPANEIVDLVLTDRAIQQVKNLMARNAREGQGLRVAVADGGCSGYSYKLEFDQDQKPEDTVLERNGLKVFIDRNSAAFLKGTVIDFVSGLYGGGFKFTNPNATGTCGCGTSFST